MRLERGKAWTGRLSPKLFSEKGAQESSRLVVLQRCGPSIPPSYRSMRSGWSGID